MKFFINGLIERPGGAKSLVGLLKKYARIVHGEADFVEFIDKFDNRYCYLFYKFPVSWKQCEFSLSLV